MSNSPLTRNRVIAALAGLAIIGAIVWILFALLKPGPKADLDGYREIGRVAAAEIVRLTGGAGEVLVVRPAPGLSNSILVETEVEEFVEKLKDHGIKLVAIEELVVDPQLLEGALDAANLTQLADKYPAADVIISFVGVAPFHPSELQGVSGRRPKLVSVSLTSVPSRILAEQGIVQVAIGPRPEIVATGRDPENARAWFEKYFVVLTEKDIVDWPAEEIYP